MKPSLKGPGSTNPMHGGMKGTSISAATTPAKVGKSVSTTTTLAPGPAVPMSPVLTKAKKMKEAMVEEVYTSLNAGDLITLQMSGQIIFFSPNIGFVRSLELFLTPSHDHLLIHRCGGLQRRARN
jgi:hypothetical protein